MQDRIIVRGAREHNLKNINVEIPRDKLVVITGLSGSGKSSLAFDTIYAEGQRRYVESLSAYARQFLGLMEKPDVDQIEGLSPAISIDQKSSSRNPRSTVGTVTEIYDYLRLLFARIGTPHCPICGREVTRQTSGQIVDQVLALPADSRIMILAPIIDDKKGEHRHVAINLRKAGYSRVRVDGTIYDVNEFPDLDKQRKHTVEAVVDRLSVDVEIRQRLTESVEQALALGEGVAKVLEVDSGSEHTFSEHYACELHPEVSLPEIAPRNFSFNSPHGACPHCTGLGHRLEVDPELIIPNRRLSIAEGSIRPWARTTARLSWYSKLLESVAKANRFSIDVPISDMKPADLKLILYGASDQPISVRGPGGRTYHTTYEGVIPNLERRYHETDSDFVKREIEKYMAERECPVCLGRRLKPEMLAVTVMDKSIVDITTLSIDEAADFFAALKLAPREAEIARQILKEVRERLQFLQDVGLSYLTLDRSANTLAGGEAQRIRLATQIGSSLMGVLYILDEPSIGLHQRDNDRLISTLTRLRDLGNTVIVVEHDEDTIRASDYVIDIGPLAGEHGGRVVAADTPDKLHRHKESLTAKYLTGELSLPVPLKRRSGNGKSLVIKNAREHNLQNIDVEIPLGRFVTVTGVSGSGKSSLINDILAKKLSQVFHRAGDVPGQHDDIVGLSALDKVISVDQSPIGRTPRSNPATYTGVFTDIRDLFAATPEAKIRGYKAGRFSFNVKGGRCEVCRGDGILKIEMHFLPDVYVTCEECKGKRYNREALEIHYKGKNISEVLDMTVEEAVEFFENIPSVRRKFETLNNVGLGYIHLGQAATTFSGGEAQRIKLATELARRSTGRTLYILDEPTTGLHFDDVKRLLGVLEALVEMGNSVLVIEHNLDVIKSSDWVIDLGPEGGTAGGLVVATGTPEKIAGVEKSHTGRYLKRVLAKKAVPKTQAKPKAEVSLK
ncbi:MAG TPA: excinuclease ABC subunit UvrA [Candidatus Saccharimonadales bacterium]|nr:excinuclease ABC subunit UvrA [Candidatus Saccharimonadales bacterium]